VDSFTAALSRLDPASRALLDLSLRRGMRPEEIGELLGTDPESVIVAREGALEQLASELGMDDVSELDDVRARLAELPAAAWTGEAMARAAEREPETPAVEAAGPESAERGPEERTAKAEPAVAARGPAADRKPAERERKSRLPLLLALLAVAAIVLVVVLASSGGDEDTTAASSQPSNTQAQKPKPHKSKPAKPAAPKPGPTVKLTPLSDARGATGSAALTQGGKRLAIKVSGLPPASYQVWLYDSVIDTVSLTKVKGAEFDLDLKLPRNASHFRYVDISREPADGNPNHSGESVLRVPLAKLSR
jgi:hypothetical protein